MTNRDFHLDPLDESMLAGDFGAGTALAMRILVSMGRLLGADGMLDIRSAHIDGCLYHGDSGVLFAEKLVACGAKVKVPSTLNVGALDLLHAGRERLSPETRDMARRMTTAYIAMNCRPTWTCAPYQAGHRPRVGEDVAWGESNAVVFCNSVLGARTNRYGDFLDICAAVTGRAPRVGLHLPVNRRATVLIDVAGLSREFLAEDTAYPILGAWLGLTVGNAVAAFQGLGLPGEDQLKALGAAAASTGAVGLFHVIGVTPEAATRDAVFAGKDPERIFVLTPSMLEQARRGLSTSRLDEGDPIDAVAIGSPHLSADELRELGRVLGPRSCSVPFYACTSRQSIAHIGEEAVTSLESRGIIVVADTCVVVTPLLPATGGTLVTNSGKFAFYTPANTGYEVIFASLSECVESAVCGRLSRARTLST